MILGAELGMLVMGIIALTTGKLTFGKTKVVTGPLAKSLGKILLLPIPVAWVLKSFVDLSYVTKGKVVPDASNSKYFWTLTAIEALVVIACMAAVYAIGLANATDPAARPEDPVLGGDVPDQ